MLKTINALVDRILSVIGAILFCQIPHIINLYIHLLKGALHEAKQNLIAIENQAIINGLSLKQFIQKHLENPDPTFQSSGKVMNESLERFQNYKQILLDMENAEIWEKPYYFIKNVDWDLLMEIKLDPILPLNAEAIIYAIFGILAGLLIHFLFFRLPFMLLGKKKKPYQSNVYHGKMYRKP